jgi:hypothetical protein
MNQNRIHLIFGRGFARKMSLQDPMLRASD